MEKGDEVFYTYVSRHSSGISGDVTFVWRGKIVQPGKRKSYVLWEDDGRVTGGTWIDNDLLEKR